MFKINHLILFPTLSIIGLAVFGACDMLSSSDDDKKTTYELILNIEPEGGGSVTPDGGTFDQNEKIELTATPSTGWAFTGWSGSMISTDNPLSFNIGEDTDLTAHFADQSQNAQLLNGQYVMTHTSYRGNGLGISYFIIDLDGRGSGNWEELYSTDTSTGNGSLTYLVNDDHTFTVTPDDDQQQRFYGIVHQDGQTYTMVDTGEEYGINIGIKKSSGMSNASLSGEFIMVQISHHGSSPFVSYYLITLDGSGSGTWEELYTTDPAKETGTLAYSVNDDGTLTVDAGIDLTFRGIVHNDGKSFTMASTGNEYGINVGIKKSSGMADGRLKGEYIMSNITLDENTNETNVTYFLITLDGNGQGNWEELYTTYDSKEGGTLSYSVNSDGTFIVDVESQLTFRGIVHDDGESYIMAGTGEEFGINVGIRKEIR